MEEANQESHQIMFKSVDLFELTFLKLSVVARIREKITDPHTKRKKRVKAKRQILKDCTGMFSPNTFTAIVGPSGCGKTTLLNLLSGRLLSQNLILDGQIMVNNKACNDINMYGEKIGYVMQQDILLATFTPRECFTFIANMRLTNITRAEKKAKVDEMIEVLGLKKCADTYIGNELIRGVSGGEKKRTSIGVELLINPSILFLDEPTTGLDSTTALHVIQFLNKLAKHGRTIISTIHQPSSQIFAEFDRLIIMVQGSIVYQGSSKDSPYYFQQIGFPVPKRSNPTDFYMKTMNKEGVQMKYMEQGIVVSEQQIKGEFTQLIDYFIQKYSQVPMNLNPTVTRPLVKSEGQGYLPFLGQVWYISIRSLVNQFRNPLDVTLRTIQIVFQAVLGIILFYKKGDTDFNRIQNAEGAIFFMLSCVIFAGIFANLAAFNLQRSVFIRERMSNTYSTASFFVGRNVAALPLDLIMPALFIAIFYWPVHLTNTAKCFFWGVFISQLAYWMSASYGLLLSAIFKDITVVMALVPVVIIPLMLVGGFFTNLRNVPKLFYPLEYVSMFKYGWQAYIENNYRDGTICPDGNWCDILKDKYNFIERYWVNLFLMFIIGLAMRGLAAIGLYFLSNPKRVKLGSKKNAKLKKQLEKAGINPNVQVAQNPNQIPPATVQLIPVETYYANQLGNQTIKRSRIVPIEGPVPSHGSMSSGGSGTYQSRVPLVEQGHYQQYLPPAPPIYVTDEYGHIHPSAVSPPIHANYPQVPYPPQGYYNQHQMHPQYPQQPYPPQPYPYHPSQYSQPKPYNPTFTDPYVYDNLKLTEMGKNLPIIGPGEDKSKAIIDESNYNPNPIRKLRESIRDDADRIENVLPNVLQPGNYKSGFINALRITTI